MSADTIMEVYNELIKKNQPLLNAIMKQVYIFQDPILRLVIKSFIRNKLSVIVLLETVLFY